MALGTHPGETVDNLRPLDCEHADFQVTMRGRTPATFAWAIVDSETRAVRATACTNGPTARAGSRTARTREPGTTPSSG
jgi:hypothetical protein